MTRIYDIGPFRLDSGTGVLTKGGVPMELGSRAAAVLTTLVERSNEYVQKGSIIDAAWPGVVVEEGNLAVQISRSAACSRKRLAASTGSRPRKARLSLRRTGHRAIRTTTWAHLAARQALESARAADVVHRSRARAGGDQAAVAGQAPVDPGRHGRHRQDAARVAGGGRSDGGLPRRRVARRAWVDQQSVAGADVGGASARRARNGPARRSRIRSAPISSRARCC